MRTIYYSYEKLITGAALGVFMVPGGYWLTELDIRKAYYCGWVFMILGPIMLIGVLNKLVGDRVALRWDENLVHIKTLWRQTTARWPDVVSITRRAQNGSQSIVIKVQGGVFGSKNYNLSPAFIDLGGDGVGGLMAKLENARRGQEAIAPQATATATRPQPVPVASATAGAFDPDAAIARYLANRDIPATQPNAERRPVMLNGVPVDVGGVPSGATPVRKQFGRRGI